LDWQLEREEEQEEEKQEEEQEKEGEERNGHLRRLYIDPATASKGRKTESGSRTAQKKKKNGIKTKSGARGWL
jgi:hypothetical protein